MKHPAAGDEPGRTGLGVWWVRIVRSVFPVSPVPRSDHDRARVTRFTFLLHLRPVLVEVRTLRWSHTFGLGGSSLVLVAILALTGLLMMLHYRPVPGEAYRSVVTLEEAVAFGPLVRGMHWWSASVLIVVMLLHAARVLLTGGWHGPRQLNWVIGCGLVGVVLTAAFTGYLLPWDQVAYWAVTISTGMLSYVPVLGDTLRRVVVAGPEIGADTLVLFYAVHTSIVPTLLIVLLGFHFWRVRRAGGVVVPPPSGGEDEPRKVHFLPHLLVREVVQALVVTACVVMLGAAIGAPLGEAANPGMSPNPVKAPWFFVGFQELLIHLHPVFAVLVAPLAVALGLVLLPYLGSESEPEGAWLGSAIGRRSAATAAITAAIATPLAVVVDELVPGSPGWFLGGLLPTAFVTAITLAFAWQVRRRLGATRNETLQAVVVLLAVAFAILTLIGVWFRGEGMVLTWPWLR